MRLAHLGILLLSLYMLLVSEIFVHRPSTSFRVGHKAMGLNDAFFRITRNQSQTVDPNGPPVALAAVDSTGGTREVGS
jgi:hypothetical protein